MAKAPTRQSIALNDLLNDEENPRHPEVSSQIEIINWMLNEYGSELLNLAGDIAEKGLSQLETMMAIPSAKQKGKYTIIEGNRRLLSLRLFANPSLAADHPKWMKKFQQLHDHSKKSIPRSIEVLVAPDRDSVYWMIERRHSGEDAGRGLKPWTAQQKARAERSRDGVAQRYEQALQVIDYAFSRNLLGADSKRLKESEFRITNLERLIADANFRHRIGIDFPEGKLVFTLDPDEVHKGLTRVLADILNVISVSDIKNADNRREYVDGMGEDLPNPKEKLDEPLPADDVPPPPPKPTTPKSNPHPHKRKHIIGTPIKVKDKNIQRVYGELKSLVVEDYPVATGSMIRVFLEQSLDFYIKEKNLKPSTKSRDGRATLKEKIISVSDTLNSKSLLEKSLYKALENIKNGRAGIADPDLLHMHLHSRYHLPAKKDLIDIWDSPYGPFLTAIWEDL